MRRAAAVAAALLTLLPAVGASAQRGDTEPAARVVVTAVSGVVGPGAGDGGGTGGDDPDRDTADLTLRVLVSNDGQVDLDDLQLVVDVHAATQARSQLQQALDGQAIGTDLVETLRVDVRDGETLLADEVASVAITVDGDGIGWRNTQGVYPVQVSVLNGATVLDRVTTAVVHLSDPTPRPLQTSLVWPLSAPPTRNADGSYTQAVPPDLEPGGRLDVLLTAVEGATQAPLMLAPETELVEELADRSDGFTLADGTRIGPDDPAAEQASNLLERLRTVVTELPNPPVIGPYGRADLGALASGPPGVAELAAATLDTARVRTQALLGRAPDPDNYLSTTPLTRPVLELLAVDMTVLLHDDQVDRADSTVDLPPARVQLEPRQRPSRLATVADPTVAAILADPPVEGGIAVAAQRLVAETALLYLTAPGIEGRALLALPPLTWDPPPGVAPATLAAMLEAPWLELVAPDDATPAIDLGDAFLVSSAATLPTTVSAEVATARRSLDALRQALPAGVPDLGGQTLADLDDALMRALTPEALAGQGQVALGNIRAVSSIIEEAFGGVTISDNQRVTLTSSTGEVPVTLRRTAGGPIDVIVEVTSRGALQWTGGAQSTRTTLTPGATHTVEFATEATARGLFPVTVRVFDPTHERLLAQATLSVRATAISRRALAAVAAVVAILLLIGARRRRTPNLEVVR